MPSMFSDVGMTFLYPENWVIEREEIENGWTATVQSPETSFLVVCRRDDGPAAADLAAQALSDLKSTYPDLESEPAKSKVGSHPAAGFDASFFLFDLTNTCWIRSFEARGATYLVMWQVNDLEADRHEPVLQAITASMKVTG